MKNKSQGDSGLGDIPGFIGLKESRSPEKDLWPGILAEIGRRKATRLRSVKTMRLVRPFALAAALAAALAVGINIGTSSAYEKNFIPAGLRKALSDYEKSEELVLYSLGKHSLPPAVAAAIQENLNAIGKSADTIIDLLRDDPDSADLLGRLYKINSIRFEMLRSIRDMLGDGEPAGDDLTI